MGDWEETVVLAIKTPPQTPPHNGEGFSVPRPHDPITGPASRNANLRRRVCHGLALPLYGEGVFFGTNTFARN